ncbi:MAG: histidinol-phosphatase [Epsilonproteobacteria bacterium]|nr:histidinol-phosphatase [Campylobacterota bacterium]
MIVDLHNHTPLCNHAEGEPEAYIKAAIEAGSRYFGFADHAPMDYDPKYRMGFADMARYEAEVLRLKESYKEHIEILLGYEVDYLEGHMDERVLNAKVDYLIGSVHFIGDWGFDNPEFIGRYEHEDIDAVWQKYFDAIEAMAKSELFQIVGHLDLIKVFKYMPTKPILSIASNALLAIKESGMALELNVAGYRKPVAEPYPSLELLQEANRLGIPITFASDAHKPEQVNLFENAIVSHAKAAGYSECVYFIDKEMHRIPF